MLQCTKSELLERMQRYKIIQGPLAGVSSVVFRDLIWKYSQPAWTYSEMIAAKTILHPTAHTQKRYLSVSAGEGPLCLQIACGDSAEAAQVCTRLNGLNISMIDLNVGCPVKKIRRRGQGSSLLANPAKLKAIITAMREHSDFPISVKIRVDGWQKTNYNAAVLDVVNESKPDFLVVHGRSYLDDYTQACHLEQIQYFAKNALMPTIANGDVVDAVSAQRMLKLGCAAVMISRASVGAPWLIGKIQQQMGIDDACSELSLLQKWDVFVDHIKNLSVFFDHEGLALAHARGLIKYYLKNNQFNPDLSTAVINLQNLQQLSELRDFVVV